ncbi:hypothetical protein C8R45DRAFT_1089240 [Mycena sanguinolenta]|nr:hypothetical protein C8R45DRAFT_1089240 [Mycena sanguinolenta]
MPAISPSLDLNLQNTYGALLIGCFLSVAVWGISLVQTILYFMMYEKDPPQLKLMILFLIAIDTVNEILVLRSVWPALILHWGRVDILGRSEGTVELIHHVWVAAIVAAVVQSYYTRRIYTCANFYVQRSTSHLSDSQWSEMAHSVSSVGLGPYNFLAFKHAAVSSGKQTQQLTAVAISLRATGAATDILIAGVMIYLLNQPRTQIPGLLWRIIILSINSGAWTAILAVLDFIFIVAFPVDFTFCIFELPLCSLYLSTLLLNLNARKFISPVQTNIDLGEITWSENRTRTESGETIPQQLSTGPAYLSQAASGSATLQKLTLTLPEDLHVMKAGEARV